MKKSLSILLWGVWSGLALAGGEHAGGHDARGRGHATGQAGDPAKVSRTIEVTMSDDMRFTPNEIKVKEGETIRFFVKNVGKIPHEMVIGSLNELKEHAEMMRKMPGMQHAEPNMITLAPGQRGGIVWQFNQAGAIDFACLVPGHMEAGMVGKIEVRLAASSVGADHRLKAAQAAAAPTHAGQGTIKAVDAAGLKVKLDHGPIASLKWPGMTMDFRVQKKKLLEGIKPGMRVEFELAQDKSRDYVITRIKPLQ